MANKTDPGMRLVNLWMPKADADALILVANSRGTSRSDLLRSVARQIIENDKEQAC